MEVKRELVKQRRKYRARRIIQEMQKVKNKHAGCRALYCEKEKATTSDRQKRKEELERYSRSSAEIFKKNLRSEIQRSKTKRRLRRA